MSNRQNLYISKKISRNEVLTYFHNLQEKFLFFKPSPSRTSQRVRKGLGNYSFLWNLIYCQEIRFALKIIFNIWSLLAKFHIENTDILYVCGEAIALTSLNTFVSSDVNDWEIVPPSALPNSVFLFFVLSTLFWFVYFFIKIKKEVWLKYKSKYEGILQEKCNCQDKNRIYTRTVFKKLFFSHKRIQKRFHFLLMSLGRSFLWFQGFINSCPFGCNNTKRRKKNLVILK